MLLWRIAADTPDYASDDRTGKGAELKGGRWNRPGTPMIYTSSSRALACLETLVHFGSSPTLPLDRFLVEFTVPDDLWDARTVFDPDQNIGWTARPAGLVSLDWGTSWAQDVTSLVAEVPSVIVGEEPNVLINPVHPDAGKVGAHKVREWFYDPRLGPQPETGTRP